MNSEKIINIYVSCDRWCERCAFGSRCEAYAANEAFRKKGNLKDDDVKNALFWTNIQNQLPGILLGLEKKAKENSVDLEVFEGIPKGTKFDLFQRKAVTNDVLKAGRKYEDAVDDWLDSMADEGRLQMMELVPGSVFRLISENLSKENKVIANGLIEVVMRYQLQIYVKLSRLYYTQSKEAEEGLEQHGLVESDAVAKMVLEIIGRSLVSWWGIMNFFPDQGAFILDILFLLQRLRNRLTKEFPQAQFVIRPGFDD